MLKIEPIKLLRGRHADTGTTGQGCVMNVIAYLNGEPQITDQSPCVCFVARPILIWLNDFLMDNERHLLIPYIERAMGSRSDDPAVFVPRAQAAARFAARCAEIVKSAKWAAWSAADSAKWAAWSAADLAWSAAASAVKSARSAEWAAGWTDSRLALRKAAFAFLDEVLPPAPDTQPAVVIERAQKLLALV